MDIRSYMEAVKAELDRIFTDHKSGFDEHKDPRAFGATIEEHITDRWEDVCEATGSEPVRAPGRKTIYDFAARHKGVFFGFDVKTKDLDTKRYSDGGVCSVGNLLKFVVNDGGIFVIIEVGHSEMKDGPRRRNLEHISVAPFHLLPRNAYRIQNLGTGQVRLNDTVHQLFEKIEWDRTWEQFFDIFVNLSIEHYEKVGQVARKRIAAMESFRDGGYEKFQF